jgi:hypothetical protein
VGVFRLGQAAAGAAEAFDIIVRSVNLRKCGRLGLDVKTRADGFSLGQMVLPMRTERGMDLFGLRARRRAVAGFQGWPYRFEISRAARCFPGATVQMTGSIES